MKPAFVQIQHGPRYQVRHAIVQQTVLLSVRDVVNDLVREQVTEGVPQEVNWTIKDYTSGALP